MIIPPKGSSVVRLTPTKRRQVVRWRISKRTLKIAPESAHDWEGLGWLATLLLAAVVCIFLLGEQSAVKEKRFEDNVIDGEVRVVDGEVGVIDSVGSRTSPPAEKRDADHPDRRPAGHSE